MSFSRPGLAVIAATLLAACASTPPNPENGNDTSTGAAPDPGATPTDAEELRAGGGRSGTAISVDPAKALEAALQDPDPRSRAESLEALYSVFQGHAQLSEIIASIQVQTYAELHEIEAMRAWSRKVQVRDDPSYADVLNGMAYAYAEIGEHLEEGLIRLDQALAIVDRLEARLQARGGSRRPHGSLVRRRAAFLDTRGWLHFKLGRLEPALADLEASAALMDDAEIHWHRCQVLERLGRKAAAGAACAEVVALEDTFEEEARARLAQLVDDPATAVKEAGARQARRGREAVLSRAIDRPTPKLTLEDASGAPLLLGGEEQPGAVQVFWLWATWCKPCLAELPILEAMAGRKENQDVRFLAVNVDEDRLLAQRFLERRKLALPVAFGPGRATLETLDVGGLPALFVRDASGRIQFVHLGANPALEVILQAEIDALKGAP